jgi:hypothetical protein
MNSEERKIAMAPKPATRTRVHCRASGVSAPKVQSKAWISPSAARAAAALMPT